MVATSIADKELEFPESDQPFRIEQHGMDFIPESERWAKPRDLFGMWAGASVQVEYFVYGAILMTFGFTFAQALSIIIIGNISYLLLGLCSLQGPNAGTTAFGINRASFGPNGSRVIAFLNWATQVGFEVEGLILIVFAGIILTNKAGFHAGTPAKAIFVAVAVIIQFLLPFLGHATILKALRALIIPFVALFAVMLGFTVAHAHTNTVAHGAGWQVYMAGLAFAIVLAGLGWTENGNDYSRYLPPDASKKAIVGWVFLGTAVPQILIMTLGAAVGTFLASVGTLANPFAPFLHQSAIPAWFVVVFLIFSVLQLFSINSLDLYSSGVSLQAIGLKVKRWQAVIIDSAIGLGLTYYAVFNASFSLYLKDFVSMVIIWIAPWAAIYLVDWCIRRFSYVPSELQRTDKSSIYWANGGVNWAAIIAQLVGMFAAVSALLAPENVNLPHWMNEITVHTGGADFSVFTGMATAAVVYLVLGWRIVRKQADAQNALLKAQHVLPT